MNTSKTGYKILHFPLTKIVVGLIVCVAVAGLGQILVEQLLEFTNIDGDFKKLILGITIALLGVVSYVVLFKNYEKREITELSTKNIWRTLLFGFLIGAFLQSLTILVIYLFGSFTILSVNNVIHLIPAFTMALTAAIFEEILFRGIIYRLTEEKLGSYLALIISALIFGALHLGNPNSSIVAGVGIAIQAGLLLGVAYIYSKNLWFPIAIHFAWNFTQSGIYGASTSGHSISNSLLTTKIEGAELISGGQFGPEGSIQATLFCLAVTIILLVLSHKQNKIIKPFWKK